MQEVIEGELKIKEVLKQKENRNFFERLDTRFDISRLREELAEIQQKYPPCLRAQNWGGWSLLSASGHYQDGWQLGHQGYKEEDGVMKQDPEKLAELGYQPAWKHTLPTEIIRPELLKVLGTFKNLKLLPCRARLALLKSPFKSAIHRDALAHQYAVRIHVPITTNETCLFVSEKGWAHLPADGSSYLLEVNHFHQVINEGPSDRVHLIADIFDRFGATRFPMPKQ